MNSTGSFSHRPRLPSSIQYLAADDTVLISSPVLGPENPPPNGLVMGFISMNHLPPPALGNINDVERAIKHLARNQASKDRVCEFIVQEVSVHYILTQHVFSQVS